MRLIAFAAFLTAAGVASIACAQSDCGESGSRWLGDFHVQGTGQAPQVVLPINARLNLEVTEAVGFTIVARDRNTGENIFGTPLHGAENYHLTPRSVRARRAGVVLSTNDNGNITPLETGPYGGVLMVDARDLYSNREDPDDTSKYELFAKGTLHICWK
jgi:hypothetical protein